MSNHVLNRIILGVALFGVLVIVHLGIQQSRGFDMGCLGFTTSAAVEATFDCSAVVRSTGGTLLGFSNVAWGMLFYLVVSAMSIAILLDAAGRGRTLEKFRAAVIGGGLLYSAFLVYQQVFVIRGLCALCLISAAVVGLLTILAVLQIVRMRGRSAHQDPQVSSMKEFRFIGVAVALVAVLSIADVMYFNSIEPARAATTGTTSPSAPGSQAAAHDVPPAACGFSDEVAPIQNYDAILGVTDPMEGNPDASVTFIEFFDPNCPHCRTQHEVTKMLIEDFGDQVRFFFKPVPLWPFSVAQIEALYAAAQDGKFNEMLGGQFDRQRQGGLAMSDLREIATQIGMDANQLEQRIERGLYRNTTMQQREIAASLGLRGVPAVFINGRMVEGRSRTVACLRELLEDAAG
jgi:protein-disulfide isomerase/uncharacterized membrane protein